MSGYDDQDNRGPSNGYQRQQASAHTLSVDWYDELVAVIWGEGPRSGKPRQRHDHFATCALAAAHRQDSESMDQRALAAQEPTPAQDKEDKDLES